MVIILATLVLIIALMGCAGRRGDAPLLNIQITNTEADEDNGPVVTTPPVPVVRRAAPPPSRRVCPC